MTYRTEFRRRLDRLTERLSAVHASGSQNNSFETMSKEEADAYLNAPNQELADDPECIERMDRLSKMTGPELDECLRMFSIHPSKRGGWKL